MKQMISKVSRKAGAIGVSNFVTLFKAYLESVQNKNSTVVQNATDFTDPPNGLELESGTWYADDSGVYSTDKYGFDIVACNHPIMPIKRLVNIDTGIEKIEIAYRKGKRWRTMIADKRTLASANSIVTLADYGVAVNSENGKHLVRYLTDIEHLNYDRLEEQASVGRLGWIDDYGFSPYVENLAFDGDVTFRHFFDSVQSKGDYQKWLDLCKEIRQGGMLARLMLAASFASVLVKPCDALPFFVHLWGGAGTGKTVGLMLAASVWANPEMGRYIHTFNSTAVAQELSAGFVNSLPLILDELQIVKDRKDFDRTIYQLAEGVGRSRGQKTGGLQRIESWANCILTTGEMPITNSSSGGGAVSRVIEIDCQDQRLFDDAIRAVDVLKRNYGFAGRVFVEMLQQESNMEYATGLQKQIFEKLMEDGKTTDKQAGSASIILTADALIDKWIFKDGKTLEISDIEQFLSTKEQVSPNIRALQYLYDFTAMHSAKFKPNPNTGEYVGEIWGFVEDGYICIIRHQFEKILQAEGYNAEAFLSWAKRGTHILCEKGRYTKQKKYKGEKHHCVYLKAYDGADSDGFIEMDEDEIGPVFPV